MKQLAVVVFLLSLPAFPAKAKADPKAVASPQLVVHLLDYLAKDYGGAVQDGKIISKSEYSEQIEFAKIVRANTTGVSDLAKSEPFTTDVARLQKLIAEKASANEVAKLARELQQQAIQLSKIEVAPTSRPDLGKGAKIYEVTCVSCHGASGLGDGIAGQGLDPKPANFHDAELVLNSSPYKFYNTIRLGVPGTGMAAFTNLSDEEVWDLAFYLKSLPFKPSPPSTLPTISLKEASTLTDLEIEKQWGGAQKDARAAVSALRAIGFPTSTIDPLDVAKKLLSESLQAARTKDYPGALAFSLNAYLEGIEPLEPKMKANIPGFVEEIESMMSQYRSALVDEKTLQEIGALHDQVIAKLDEAEKKFAQSKMSPAVAFWAAFSIFLREGFEAVLIIIVLISILRAMNQSQAVKWVHFGWASAVAMGLVLWFASGLLLSLSGLSREIMEGTISLLAVLVLLYVGFWLHRYSEVKKWRGFLETKLKHGLSRGSYFALSVVAFMAVFREAFEVVLFLRAIWIDLDPAAQAVAGSGVLSSLILVTLLTYVAIKGSKKVPLGILFQICSWTMIVLAIILVGKGFHSLQEAGVVGVTSLGMKPRIDLLGVYPSLETLSAQLVLLLAFSILLFRDYSGRRTSS